ncbi:MAG: cytidine/deoxycytidylate deaminase family protein [bacterium]|nr:cytidine/deoxycytidylate deaminase family protein [bacterium]
MAEERAHFRPDWDDYFMVMVKIIATRGNCDRLYTGAIIVKNKRIIATGYNGAPPGLPTCREIGHLIEEGHCVRTIHGEHNAILQAARVSGPTAEDATLYTKYSPCIHCAKYIIAAGIKRVVIGKIYRNPQALDLLKEAGLETVIYKENPEWQKELLAIFSEDIPERVNEGKIVLKNDK